MRNLVGLTVGRCFAVLRFRLSRVRRFPRSRSARAPCTGYNQPFAGSLCLKGNCYKVPGAGAGSTGAAQRAPRGFDPAWEIPSVGDAGPRGAGAGRGAAAGRPHRKPGPHEHAQELPRKCLAPRCSVCRAFYCSACSEPHTSQQRVMEPTHDTHRALRPHTQSPRTATAVSAQASSSPASAKAISALTAQT